MTRWWSLVLLLLAFAAMPAAGLSDSAVEVTVASDAHIQAPDPFNATLDHVEQALPLVESEVAMPPGAGLAPKPTPEPTATQVAAGAATGLTVAVLLAYLAKAFGFGLFSRMEGEQMLDHPTRRLLLDIIERNPAISLSDIVRAAGAGWGTVVFHLRRLEAERIVVSERVRGRRCFFRNGGAIANEEKRPYAELQNDTAMQIARAILERPGAAQKDLCEAVGVKAPVAHKYLERMADAHLVAKQREWRTVKYFPTAQLAVWA